MDFLKNLFGEKWGFRFLLLTIFYLILLLWPAYYFSREIAFHPATFTQEWIKSVSSISIIFVVLEYQKFLFDSNKRKLACKESLERKLLIPLKNFVDLLRKLENPTREDLDKIIKEWSKIYSGLIPVDLYSYNVSFKNKKVYDFKNAYELDGINNKIMGFITQRRELGFDDIINKISLIIEEFETELKHLN